jgi:Icc-related predicted phosphoesterase
MENKKLRIGLATDLHIEFGPITLNNTENADVLILAGDICVTRHFVDGKPSYQQRRAQEYRTFFDHVTKEFPHVVYIAGNHESYGGDVAKTLDILREHLVYDNLHILEKQTWHHAGIGFVCGTLWTDMNASDPVTITACKSGMNDFREIRNSARMVPRQVPVYKTNPDYTADGVNGTQYLEDANGNLVVDSYKHKQEPGIWSPQDSVADHVAMLDHIDHATCNPGRYIVVGHHAPSERSVHEYYKGDRLNGAFRTELDEFIKSRPQIELWVHGHMHNSSDYYIGSTRVVCNPRGYIGHEAQADRFELKYIEV